MRGSVKVSAPPGVAQARGRAACASRRSGRLELRRRETEPSVAAHAVRCSRPYEPCRSTCTSRSWVEGDGASAAGRAAPSPVAAFRSVEVVPGGQPGREPRPRRSRPSSIPVRESSAPSRPSARPVTEAVMLRQAYLHAILGRTRVPVPRERRRQAARPRTRGRVPARGLNGAFFNSRRKCHLRQTSIVAQTS